MTRTVNALGSLPTKFLWFALCTGVATLKAVCHLSVDSLTKEPVDSPTLHASPTHRTNADQTTAAPRPATEQQVVAIIIDHLDDLVADVGTIHQFGAEVRTHGRSRADVLLRADHVVAIEAKLSDWRRALGQAVLNTSVVDRSYVAMWEGRIPAILLVEAKKYRVGVIAVSHHRLYIVVPAGYGSPDVTARATLLARLQVLAPSSLDSETNP